MDARGASVYGGAIFGSPCIFVSPHEQTIGWAIAIRRVGGSFGEYRVRGDGRANALPGAAFAILARRRVVAWSAKGWQRATDIPQRRKPLGLYAR